MTEAGMLNLTIRDNPASPPRRIVGLPTFSVLGEMAIISRFEREVMGSIPVGPAMPPWTNLVKSALSKGAVLSVRI